MKTPDFDHIRIHSRNRKEIEELLKKARLEWRLAVIAILIPLVILILGIIGLLIVF